MMPSGDKAIFEILLPPGVERSAVIEELEDAAIQASIHTFGYYRSSFGPQGQSLARTEAAAGCELTLPLYSTMGEGSRTGGYCRPAPGRAALDYWGKDIM